MRALLNPLLLLVCILLLAFDYVSAAAGEGESATLETWVLTLCLLGALINGTLGVARAMTQRPSVASIAWAVAFLISGCVVWAMVSGERLESVSSQERALLHERVDAWKSGQLAPFSVDEQGDGVLTLAAGLGEGEIVAEVLSDAPAAKAHAGVMACAAHRAAERNRWQVLRQLVAAGVSVDARVEGLTPLHTASLNRAHRAATTLLELGAAVNAATAEGTTPLHHAVLAEDAAMIRLLLQHGADPKQTDGEGREAESYARSEEILKALESASAPQP